jgi:hypothetical protein
MSHDFPPPLPDEDGWVPPESWQLADALDRIAKSRGWQPVGRGTSPNEVQLVYKKVG